MSDKLPVGEGFPLQYRSVLMEYERREYSRIDKQIQDDITYLRNKIYDLEKRIRDQQSSRPVFSSYESKKSGDSIFYAIAITGTVIGFFAFCASCSNCSSQQSLDGAACSFFGGIGTLLICMTVGCVIGAIASSSSEKSDRDAVQSANASIDSRIAELQKEIDQINDEINRKKPKEAERMKQDVSKRIAKAQKDYEDEFERKTKELSLRYVDSSLIKQKKIVEWIMDGFGKHIDSANREKYTTDVCVPYIFSVYTNKITCARGVFDFFTQSCQFLQTAEQQAAIARAIANELQIHTVEQYPKSVRDLNSYVSYTIKYTNVSAEVTLKYTATNGLYEAPMKW